MDEAVYWIRRNTRSLAKRQLTWFRRDSRVQWLEAEGQTAEALARRMQEALGARFGSDWR